jgi:hypothetical protein
MPHIKLALRAVAFTILFSGVCGSAPASRPVVSQVHVLSIHVKDHATFDAVFLLCRDMLELPWIYGELSTPENPDPRLYAGFSVGNAYLEPCGPYPDNAPFSSEQPARFHGLTFSPVTTLDEAVKALEERVMPHSGVVAAGTVARFVYLRDTLLTGKRLAVSLWEIQDANDHANLHFLRSSLEDSQGGALGVQRLEEVEIGFRDTASLEQWGEFLAPTRNEDDVWFVGKGPALRLVPSDDLQPLSIVLRVESLKRAEAALKRKNLTFEVRPDQVELRVADTFGLQIVLKE